MNTRGFRPSARDLEAIAGEVAQKALGHLAPRRVMRAQEQDMWALHLRSWSPEAVRGRSHRTTAMARAAPTHCAAMNPGTSYGRMPAKESLAARASVTAGFAKEVDAVNQYAAVM
jgi:hypothetical protein